MKRYLPLVACGLMMMGCWPFPSDCLPEPTNDATPPNAGMIIEYHKDGLVQSKTIERGEPGFEIDADEASTVSVVYTGGDEQGLRQIQIGITVYRTNQTQQFDTAPVTLSCPKPSLFHTIEFPAHDGNRTIVLQAFSQNWVGTTGMTEQVSIHMQ